MARRDPKPLSLWIITVIVIGIGLLAGVFNGLYAERLGISRALVSGITVGLVSGFAAFLYRRHRAV